VEIAKSSNVLKIIEQKNNTKIIWITIKSIIENINLNNVILFKENINQKILNELSIKNLINNNIQTDNLDFNFYYLYIDNNI